MSARPIPCPGPGVKVKCCIEGCSAMYGEVGVSFHRFPTINTARDVLRRELWVEAAGLPNHSNVVDGAIICGQHFEKGKPSLPNDIRAPNWTPTLHLKTKVTTDFSQNTSGGCEITDTCIAKTITAPPQKQGNGLPILPIMGPQFVPKDVNLPEFCRLCLTEGVQMVFPKDSRVYDQLASKISDHLRLNITVGELTRSLICKKCYETLEQFHQFRARCARQDTYLNMRRNLEPDRKHPLRYKDNWYWYSCLGNNMSSVIWGCSVICCPAFIVSHPSGRICSKYANHQHKQKMEDVKSVYCNGEYIFDGYRYSFEMINLNRTLTFSCRSLKDPHGECTAVLISNDRSEVLSVGEHNHEREIVIESAVKDGGDLGKRSITLIRGFNQEIVFSQGYWYTTVPEQSSVSHWNCIRLDCTSTITMVNGTVQYFGTHCHLPVFLKWGAQEDKSVEPKTTTLMKVVNPAVPVATPAPSIPSIPPVALRKSTTIVRPRQSIVTAPPVATYENASSAPMITEIKTEPGVLPTVSAIPTPAVPSVPVREPLVVSAAAMASKAALPLATNKPPIVSVRSNHPIQVLRKTTISTVRVVPPPRPKLVLPTHLQHCPTALPTQVLTPKTSVPTPPSTPTIPKILHVMSLNLASQQPEVPEVPISLSESLPNPEADEVPTPVIKQEPDPDPEDEPETITDDFQPRMTTMATAPPSSTQTTGVSLPKPPPLTPRPMLLVSSASVVANNTLDVTALDPDCIDSLPTTTTVQKNSTAESFGTSQDTLSAEEDDGLTDLQDDDEIPPIVPIDADVVSRIIGSEYTTRRLPNGKTQVIRKTILSRSPVMTHPAGNGTGRPTTNTMTTTTASHFPTGQLLSSSSSRGANSVRVYGGPSTSALKRISVGGELDNPLTKRLKPSESVDPLDTSIVNVEKPLEPDEDEEPEEMPAEDPIAVSTEPHENMENEDSEPEQTEDSSNDAEEPTAGPATPPEPEGESKTEENPVPQEKSTSSPDPPVSRSDKKTTPPSSSSSTPTTSKSVQLVKLQRTEQMLSHEGHLFKLKWHNRLRNYWECMLREQVTCMAILETFGSDSRHWRKYGSHNHKVPKPIINDENRSSYRMLTNETSMANVKQLPVQTKNIGDVEECAGRMMSLSKRKLFAYRIRKVGECVTLHYADYEYKFKKQVNPGFRWQCVLCLCTIETDERFTIAQEMGMIHNHEPQPPSDVIDLVAVEGPKSNTTARDQPEPTTPQQEPASAVGDGAADQKQPSEPEEEKVTAEDDSTKGVERASQEKEQAKEGSTDPIQEKTKGKETSEAESTEKQAEVQSNRTSIDNLDNDSIAAMLQEITGENGQDDREPVAPSTGGEIAANDSDDDDEMTLDPSTGEMVNRGDLKRKEHRKALLEDIVADEDDDDTEILDPLTGEIRRKGDQSSSTVTEPLPEETPDLNASEVEPPKNLEISNDDFEELLKKGSTKETIDTRKFRKPKKNSLAALKMVMDVHKRLKDSDPQRNFQVLTAPEDSSTCLIRFNEFTYMLDSVQDTLSVWKCHLSPQYACRGKVHLSKDCQQVSATGVSHCHVSALEDMFTDRPAEQDGQIADTDQESPRDYTFFKRPDYVYQLRLDDGYLYNCLTISKTGVSCWRCADRQAHNCKAMFTMEGNFKSLVRNRFSHPHDPVSQSETISESQAADEEGGDHRSMDSDGTKDTVAGGSKRSAKKGENEDDRKKQKRQTL